MKLNSVDWVVNDKIPQEQYEIFVCLQICFILAFAQMDHAYCKKQQRSRIMCCVPFCSNRQGEVVGESKISMFNFPKKSGNRGNAKRHREWVKLLRIGKQIPKNAVVCSQHFKEGDWIPPSTGRNRPMLKRTAVPSLRLPTSSGPPQRDIPTARAQRVAERQPRSQLESVQMDNSESEHETTPHLAINTDNVMKVLQMDSLGSVLEMLSDDFETSDKQADEQFFASIAIQTDEISYTTPPSKVDVGCQTESPLISNCFCQTELALTQDSSSQTTPQVNETKNVHTETENKYVLEPVTFVEMRTDEELKTWTGLRDHHLLNELTMLLKIVEQKRRINFDMDVKTRIIMTMIVLKHVIQYNMLATLYSISDRCVSKYFTSTLLSLSEVLNPLIYWPSEEENMHSMPLCFEMYSDTTIVLDCTECKCAKLSCIDCRISTYSHYKGGHTVKYLLGVTPAGTINYISQGYPGRASDKFIFNNENVIGLLDEKGAVMTDKGFSIEKELAEKDIKLYRPPFLRSKQQFTEEEAAETKNIAKARVHVERAIERVKRFKLFKGTVPPHLLGILDHAMIVCCGLVNLGPGILADDKF